jgi:23S rRNA pseudouridine1911/1915/1917 synthase
VTYYEVIERFSRYAFVRCRPETGRTHQLRVHLTHIGHPIVADKLYSGRDKLLVGDVVGRADAVEPDRILLARQALHAHSLELNHPVSGQPLKLISPLPADMAATLEFLRKRP